MKKIDMANWPRKSLYEYFRTLPSPHFSLTADVDVTGLVEHAKPAGVSVFNAVLFAVMAACNSIPEFRQRIVENEVVEYGTVNPAPTVPIEGDRFAFAYFDFAPEWEEFNDICMAAIEEAKQQTRLKDNSGTRNDLILTTCLPWVQFTSLHHPVQGPDDSFPRVAWGKFYQQDNRWRMPVNVQVHHALADGIHMSKFYQFMQESLNTFGK